MAVKPFLIAALALLAFLGGCSNPLSGTVEQAVRDANAPEVSFYPDYPTIRNDTPVSVYFSKAIDRDTVEVTGTMADEADVSWFVSVVDGSTSSQWITLEPKTAWPSVDHLELKVRGTSTDGFDSFAQVFHYGVLDADLHVSTVGDDDNPGTATAPIRTLESAVYRTGDLNRNWTEQPVECIRVAGGVYSELGVALSDGIDLSGSWSSDWTVQDSDAHPTIIRPDFTGYEPVDDITKAFGVLFSESTIDSSVVESVQVEISGAPFIGAGFMVLDCSPTLRDVVVRADDMAGAYGILIEGVADPILENCVVEAEGCGEVYGIAMGTMTTEPTLIVDTQVSITDCGNSKGVMAMSSPVTMTRCRMDAEGTDSCTGFFVWGTAATMRNCLVRTSGPTLGATSVSAWDTDLVMQNNTLVYSRWGVLAYARTMPVMRNNLFFQEGEGLYQDEAAYFAYTAESDPLVLENNYFSNRYVRNTVTNSFDHTRLYLAAQGDGDVGLKVADALAGFETEMDGSAGRSWSGNAALGVSDATAPGYGELDETAAFADPAAGDWDLTASAPAAMQSGGLDLSSEFTDDINGDVRTGSWSIGAYQY